MPSVGRYKDAADVLEDGPEGSEEGTLPDTWLRSRSRTAAGLLRKALRQNRSFPPDFPHLDRVSFVYLYAGAPEHAHRQLRSHWIKSRPKIGGQGNSFSYVWHASYAPARKTQSFKQFVRDAGFVDYWRQRGWPDLCHPVGADDFACD